MHRITVLLFAIVFVMSTSPLTAQTVQNSGKSDSENSGSFNDTDKPKPEFENRRDERLYNQVISKLNEMQFAKTSSFIDEEPNDKIDWFIVGGSFLHKRSGELQANFATMQGAESVAKKIVEFESMDHGKGIAANWKVFDRYGGAAEASNALNQLEAEFETYKKNRIASIRRQQQQAAARARAKRSRRGSC